MAKADTRTFPSLTIEQVADRLGVSSTTIFRMIARGTAPPSYKVGKRRLWRERDVLDWLETECREGVVA
jgi:excisionase family DNA binding protein